MHTSGHRRTVLCRSGHACDEGWQSASIAAFGTKGPNTRDKVSDSGSRMGATTGAQVRRNAVIVTT